MTTGKFTCARCKKPFTTQRGLTIHAEVKREDGVLATYRPSPDNQAEIQAEENGYADDL